MRRALLAIVVLLAAAPATRAEEVPERLSQQARDFLQSIGRSTRYELDQLEETLLAWEKIETMAAKGLAESPEELVQEARDFVRDSLVALEPDYARALEALDEGKAATAAEAFTAILDEDSPHAYLEAYCALGLGQSLFDLGKYNEAKHQLSKTVEVSGHLPHLAEALFDLARACEALGLASAARASYETIVEEHSETAPPAVLETAKARAGRGEQGGGGGGAGAGALDEVAELMGESEGRLRKEDTGDETQAVQQEIVDLLQKLIEEAEKQEQSSGSASAQRSQAPASSASLPGGEGDPRNLRRVSEGEEKDSWGSLPEREREKVMQTLKEQFPTRYQELLERSYKDIQSAEK